MTETPGPDTTGPDTTGLTLSSGARIDIELRDADGAGRRLPGGAIADVGAVPVPGVGDEVAVTRSGARQAPATACYTVVRRRIGYNLEGETQGAPLRAWVVLWVRPVAAPASRPPREVRELPRVAEDGPDYGPGGAP